MEIHCASCAQPLSITDDQLGKSVQCPACRAVLLLRRSKESITNTLVTCPGCAVKLALPEGASEIYRCPKCSQKLREPRKQSLVDVWRQQAAKLSPAATVTPPPIVGSVAASVDSERPVRTTQVPPSRRSGRRPYPYYSNAVQSIAPGVLLLIQSLIALFINVFQLMATREITDHVANAEALRTSFLTTAIVGVVYQAPIMLGSIQMIMRQHVWMGKIASIMAVIPATIFTYGVYWYYFAIGLYPIALIGGVWGASELFRNRSTKRTRGRIGYV